MKKDVVVTLANVIIAFSTFFGFVASVFLVVDYFITDASDMVKFALTFIILVVIGGLGTKIETKK